MSYYNVSNLSSSMNQYYNFSIFFFLPLFKCYKFESSLKMRSVHAYLSKECLKKWMFLNFDNLEE